MLSIIFPAYNEAESLKRLPGEALPVFESLGRPYEVVIVDDGSKDDTAAVAESLGGKVRLVKHERNKGLGAALRTGFEAARGEFVITMDSDLTFAPSLVPALLERFERGDCDAVSGSPKLAGFAADIPQYRIFISKAASMVYSQLLGQSVTSVSPIFRLYRRKDLMALPLQATGFDINAEILFFLIQQGKHVVEIPAPLTQRLHGESKLDYKKEMRHHLRLMKRMALWRLGSLRKAMA
ncbi:glycosyltransferase family 2 protein [Pyxidicoccus sp. MSG2]|uniref:glycosyltransferase family 2 protein n=1 Tax=Pyxidicoccus sp. MSG2 TaxID=2996790 RepID=UPI002270F20D|nr:glycosyltransferase family 2 protein [Pyxidicoccus sp. MSG2]MCY1022014.1 glycosyltransferase family 2 protein [Pyxidicoccus sp. MSG2]